MPAAYDVAIVGAGPVGSLSASWMARGDLRVALLEKDAVPGQSTVCGGGLHVDTARFASIPDDVIERKLCQIRLSNGKRQREWFFRNPVHLTETRAKLDQALAQQAVASGAELFVGARVTDVYPEQGLLQYRASATGLCHRINARVFIFADGPNSLARRLSVGPSQRRRDGLRYVGVTYHLKASTSEFSALEFALDPGALPFGYFWIFPKRDHLNVGVIRLTCISGPPLASLLDQFIQNNPRLSGREVLDVRGGLIPAQVGPILQRRNCLVVGDAAGMVNPLTAGGYVCGFLSAALAADACVEAFKNADLNINALGRYPRRLRTTKQYLFIRSASVLLRVLVRVYRTTGKSSYPAALTGYLRAVHALMRFGVSSM